jgi:hypothetical protein
MAPFFISISIDLAVLLETRMTHDRPENVTKHATASGSQGMLEAEPLPAKRP